MVRDGLSDKVTFQQKPKENEEQHHLNSYKKTTKAEETEKNQMPGPRQLGGMGPISTYITLREQTPKLRICHKS